MTRPLSVIMNPYEQPEPHSDLFVPACAACGADMVPKEGFLTYECVDCHAQIGAKEAEEIVNDQLLRDRR